MIEFQVNNFFFNKIKDKKLKEDFREIKPYWIKKLIKNEYQSKDINNLYLLYINNVSIFKKIKKVKFKNGYKKEAPFFICEVENIRFTSGKELTCMGYIIAFAIKIKY